MDNGHLNLCIGNALRYFGCTNLCGQCSAEVQYSFFEKRPCNRGKVLKNEEVNNCKIARQPRLNGESSKKLLNNSNPQFKPSTRFD